MLNIRTNQLFKYLAVSLGILITLLVLLRLSAEIVTTGTPPPLVDQAITKMSIIQQKLSLYHWKFGSHPTREQGIKALIDFECRKSGFLREMTEYFCARELKELIAIDPWGSAIRFDFDRSIPLISSAGADKVFDTKDDIVASIFADGISIHCTTYLIDSGIFECTQNHSK